VKPASQQTGNCEERLAVPRLRVEPIVPDTVLHDLLHWDATEMNWPAAVMWTPCLTTR